MTFKLPHLLRRSGLTVTLCILAAVAVIAAVGSAIAVYDIRRDVENRREAELSRLQSHAERSASHIAAQFLEPSSEQSLKDLNSVGSSRWLRTYWQQTFRRQPYRRYAAVVSNDGTVIAHTNREQEGKQIDLSHWDGFDPYSSQRVETNDQVLTNGQHAIDVRVPIKQGEEIIGMYHAGLDADWLEDQLNMARDSRFKFWLWLISGTCGVLLISSLAVGAVTRHTAKLEHEIEAANARRVSEMHELVIGIAHEIRNPLNAIRLNLHTVGQVFRDEAALTDDEIGTMLDEMEREVARLETLMREMLGFVRTSDKRPESIDVIDEISRTMMLLRANFDEHGIDAHVDFGDEAALVAIDSTRLRQVLFNLLNNAIEALPAGGHIELIVRSGRSQVEIVVTDDGPGVAPADRDRVFVPFYSTKASGTGLGLALARKFIEEAGGVLRCEDSPRGRGSCFRILLPVSRLSVVETVS